MDPINQAIIDVLTINARQSLTSIGQRVNLSVPAVRERIQRLEASGIIRGYTVELDYEKLDRTIAALVMVRLRDGNPETIDTFLKQVETEEDIVSCSTITGDFEYVLMIRTHSMTNLEALLARIRGYGVARTNTSFLLSKKK